MNRCSLFSVTLLLATAQFAQAGVVFEIETQDHETSPPRTEDISMFAEGRLLKMQITPRNRRPGSEMIFRGDRRELIAVDHASKTYFVIDQQSMQAIAGQVQQATRQMEEALRNVPANQRAMVQQAMRGKLPGNQTQARSKPVVHRLNSRANVYGYPCILHEVRRDNRKTSDAFVTAWENIEGGTEIAQSFADMGAYMQQISNAMPQADGFDNAFSTMKELGGFPVATREYRDDGTVEEESALRSAKRQRLNPADFEPPAGYRRQQMFAGGQPDMPAAQGSVRRQPRR